MTGSQINVVFCHSYLVIYKQNSVVVSEQWGWPSTGRKEPYVGVSPIISDTQTNWYGCPNNSCTPRIFSID